MARVTNPVWLSGPLGDFAADRPNDCAIRSTAREVTWLDLAREVEWIARGLERCGVIPGSVVALHGHRTPELYAALLAVLRLRAAYLPIDPNYPAERNRYVLDHARPGLLVEQRGLGGLAAPDSCARIELDELTETKEVSQRPSRQAALDPREEPAYVLYTSGSTGLPKGVVGTVEGIRNRVEWIRQEYPVGPDEVFCSKTSLCFVDAVWDVFQPLLAGRRLVIATDEEVRDHEAFLALLRRERVTRLSLVPSHLDALLQLDPSLPDLRLLDVTGEELDGAIARAAQRAFREVVILNRYGTTEAPSALCFDLNGYDERVHGRSVPIGSPIAATSVRLEPLNGEAVGELVIQGSQVALGYVGGPDAGRSRFESHGPLRAYRTGDIVRRAEDGALVFSGRADVQVIVRGTRIEPAEVERVLRGDTRVRDCAVVAQGTGVTRHLIAYVVPAMDGFDSDALLAAMRARLPAVMVPARVHEVTKLPTLPNGKVDRRALAAWEVAPDPLSIANTTDGALADLLRALAPGDPAQALVHVHQDSLLGVALLASVRERFEVDLTLGELMQLTSVGGLAVAINEGRASHGPRLPPLASFRDSGERTMSYGQRLMWRMHKALGAGATLYNEVWGVELSGALDAACLDAALRDLVVRHSTLRMTLHEGETFRVDDPPARMLDQADFRTHTASAQSELVEAAVHAESATPFDLETGPLLRARLLQLADDRHVLVLATHHVATDAWSGRLINRDLADFYNFRLKGLEGPAAPDDTFVFPDFAAWQNACVESGVLDRQTEYWRHRLGGIQLDGDGATGSPAERTGMASLVIPADVTWALHELAESAQATFFIAHLAVCFAGMRALTGKGDLVIGSPVSHRHYPGASDIVGFLPNMLVFHQRGNPGVPFDELLADVRELALSAYANQDVPFVRVSDALGVEVGARHPLVSTTFHVPDSGRRVGAALELNGVSASLLPVTDRFRGAKFDAAISAEPTPEGSVRYAVTHNMDAVSPEDARTMLSTFEEVIRAAVGRPVPA